MSCCTRWLLCAVTGFLWSHCAAQWTFTGNTTPTWQEAIARYAELDSLHHGARLLEIGQDDDGHPLHLFVVSDGGGFSPDSIRASGKNILWITNGIHPGEPDGVDASLLLARALLESDQLMGLTVHTAVCIVPMYNVSGALQRNGTLRVNQNGPEAYGFRGNARNLDLNRDFMKMDSRNTRSLVAALTRWDPDIYMETHVSNGADHRYLMELLLTHRDKLDPTLRSFANDHLLPGLYTWMERKDIGMCPYFETVDGPPEHGLEGFVDGPRYSTGFSALQGRIGLLSESHMLKPYADRVNATFQLMLATLAVMDQHGEELRTSRMQAGSNTAAAEAFGLNWQIDTTRTELLPWKGYTATERPSAISGLPQLYYDRSQPMDTLVPWRDHAIPTITLTKPVAYLVPQAWPEVIQRLRVAGVPLDTVNEERTERVEAQRITDFGTVREPYEGHYLHHGISTTTDTIEVVLHPGDVLVPMGHRTDRLAMEMLEPRASDGFFAWGFFDSVLQQKEWFSDYVFESIAAELLAKDPELRKELNDRRSTDPAFAADAWQQLYWVYQRSPHYEPGHRLYPVMRVLR